jgi:type II secretory pathway pseudopilin PulG
MKSRKTKYGGFTIVELVVVLSVITIGLVGIMSLIMQNIQVQGTNKDHLVASMLAQEGIELVRQKRDTNWLTLSDDEWTTGILDTMDGTFIINYDGSFDFSPNEGDLGDISTRLWIDGEDFYSHSGGTPTRYYRLIFSELISAYGNDGLYVTSTVQWMEKGQTQKYEIATELYNWR